MVMNLWRSRSACRQFRFSPVLSPHEWLRAVAVIGLATLVSPAASEAPKAPPAATPAPSETPAPQVTATPAPSNGGSIADAAAMATFLDRLMIAESGGRDDVRNPRSTALGPFQFIESTFIEVSGRHFAAETAELSRAQLLDLRRNRAFARRAAEAFSRDNATQLAAAGLKPTFATLRLAFLLGPNGAIRVLTADPQARLIAIVGAQVVQANPFMAGMTAADLARWSDRNLAAAELGGQQAVADPTRFPGARAPARPAIAVRCDRGLASCRRWIALATKRVARRKLAGGADGRGRRRP